MVKNLKKINLYQRGQCRAEVNRLEQRLKKYQDEGIIGEDTELKKAIPLINLWECLLDVSHKMPNDNYERFNLIEDCGIQVLSCGNASGGRFDDMKYRTFLVEAEGERQYVSIGISGYTRTEKEDTIKTAINVAISSEEKKAHHSLQYAVDRQMFVDGKECSFPHTGDITVGKLGKAPISELREFIQDRYEKIIDGKKFYLGKLTNDRLWYMDDVEIITFVENLITYAIIRDKYREKRKQEKGE